MILPAPSPALPEVQEGDGNEEPGSDEEEAPMDVAWEPSAAQLRDLKIAHDNAGHPSNADFARLLRRGNARPEVASSSSEDLPRQPRGRH